MAFLPACGNNTETDTNTDTSTLPAFASTYAPLPSETTLITNARIIDGTGQDIENASLLISDGKITAIGKDISGDATLTINAAGKYVTPGIIDIHLSLIHISEPTRPY